MPNTILGPLKNVPITQFSCLFRDEGYTEDTETGDIFFEHAYRKHYHFVPRIPPEPLANGNSLIFCHDIFNPLYGLVDQALYPRFEQTPGVFNAWDTTDPRFYDNNGNGAMDIDELILQKTRNFGGVVSAGLSFFKKLKAIAPDSNLVGNASSLTQGLGFYMPPWSDSATFRSYCLNSTHYNSNNALFKAMRDYIGVDTEGLYIGYKSPDGNLNTTGTVSVAQADFLYLRESDLKQVWFYLKNGVPTAPTEQIVADVAVYFYYPFNKVSPFVRTSTQKIYRLISAQEYNEIVKGMSNSSDSSLNEGSSNDSGSTTKYPSHDRKVGCVPKF